MHLSERDAGNAFEPWNPGFHCERDRRFGFALACRRVGLERGKPCAQVMQQRAVAAAQGRGFERLELDARAVHVALAQRRRDRDGTQPGVVGVASIGLPLPQAFGDGEPRLFMLPAQGMT